MPNEEKPIPTIEEIETAHAEAISAGQPFVAGPLNTIILNFASNYGDKSPEFILKFWNMSRERLAQGRFTSADDKRWCAAQVAAGNITPETAWSVWSSFDTQQERDFYRAYDDTKAGNPCHADVTGDALSYARSLGLVEKGSRRVTERGIAFTKAINA